MFMWSENVNLHFIIISISLQHSAYSVLLNSQNIKMKKKKQNQFLSLKMIMCICIVLVHLLHQCCTLSHKTREKKKNILPVVRRIRKHSLRLYMENGRKKKKRRSSLYIRVFHTDCPSGWLTHFAYDVLSHCRVRN